MQKMIKRIAPGTRVLLRIDVNVPVLHGKVDAHRKGRLAAALPQIEALCKQRARVILIAHLGRPNGYDRSLSLAPIAVAMGKMLGRKIVLADDVIGSSAKACAASLQPGEVMMLENVRFEPGEEKNRKAFAKQLGKLADVYVNNAFSVAHRAHASVAAITEYLPSFAGELLEREVRELAKKQAKPFVLVIGGVKLETKIPLLSRLGKEADRILLGSALYPVLDKAGLPESITKKIVPMIDVRKDARGNVIDIGPKTERLFLEALRGAKSIVWNGPIGHYEKSAGASGTRVLAKAIAASAARTIVGGGETVDAIEDFGVAKKFSFVSTGGGAMLSFLAGEKMPGITALR